LIHDDWMDQDDRRRGGPSVHLTLARRFRSTHAGACGAILAGDYLAALATRQLADAVRRHPRQTEMMKAFADVQLSTVAGQQLDATRLGRDAEKVYELKTAAYTVAGPLALGALLAGADRRTQNALSRFARPLGIAFQLRDDLLGLFAPPKLTGKPLANDLREGKRTWTLEWALKNANARERKQLRAALGMASASAKDVRSALAAIRSSGADAATDARLTEHVQKALKALDSAHLRPAGEALLLGAARALLERGS
jgi:geranylgeranyl diphosphate synthase type I